MAEYIDIDYPLLFKDIRNREIRVTVRDLLKANHTGCVLADVAPVRHGRWSRIDYEPIGHDYICSVCGWRNDMASHYCPNCGCRMDLEDKNV